MKQVSYIFRAGISALCIGVGLPISHSETIEEGASFERLEIRYKELDEKVSRLSMEEANRQAKDFEKSLREAGVEDPKSQVDALRRDLMNPNWSKEREGVLIVGKDFIANHVVTSEDFGQRVEWQLRVGPESYMMLTPETLSVRMDPERKTMMLLDYANMLLARVGGVPPELMSQIQSAEFEVLSENGFTVFQSGTKKLVTLTEGTDFPRFVSFESSAPAYGQSTKILVKGSKLIDGIQVPEQFVYQFSTPKGTMTRTYEIVSISRDISVEVPVVEAELPFVLVHDRRFDPPLQYRTVRSLPSDSQIAEWLVDPLAFERYNEASQKLSR